MPIDRKMLSCFPPQIMRTLEEKKIMPDFILQLVIKDLIYLKMSSSNLFSSICRRLLSNPVLSSSKISWGNVISLVRLLAAYNLKGQLIKKLIEKLGNDILSNFKLLTQAEKLFALNVFFNYEEFNPKFNILTNILGSFKNMSLQFSLGEIRNVFEIYQNNRLREFHLLKEAMIQFQDKTKKNEKPNDNIFYAHYLLYSNNPEIKPVIDINSLKYFQNIVMNYLPKLNSDRKLFMKLTSYLIKEKAPLSESRIQYLVNFCRTTEELKQLEELLITKFGSQKEAYHNIVMQFNIKEASIQKLNLMSKFIFENKKDMDPEIPSSFYEKVSSFLDMIPLSQEKGWFLNAVELSKSKDLKLKVSNLISRALEFYKEKNNFINFEEIIESELVHKLDTNVFKIINNFLDNFNYSHIGKTQLKQTISNYYLKTENKLSFRVMELIENFLGKSTEINQLDNNFLFLLLNKLNSSLKSIPRETYISLSNRIAKLICNLHSLQLDVDYEIYRNVLLNTYSKNQLLDYFIKIFPSIQEEKSKNIILACIIENNPQMIYNYLQYIQNFLNNFKFLNHSEMKNHHFNLLGALNNNQYPGLVQNEISSIINSFLNFEISKPLFYSIIPIVNSMNRKEINYLFNSQLLRYLKGNETIIAHKNLFTNLILYINSKNELLNIVDHTISEDLKKKKLNFQEVVFLSKIVVNKFNNWPLINQFLSNRIQDIINQEINPSTFFSNIFISIKTNYEFLSQIQKYKLIKKIIVPENLMNLNYLLKLYFLIKKSKFDLETNLEIRNSIKSITKNQKIPDEIRSDFNSLSCLFLEGAYLILTKDLNPEEVKVIIDKINHSINLQSNLAPTETIMLHYLKYLYPSMNLEIKQKLKFENLRQLDISNYNRIRSCLNWLNIPFERYSYELDHFTFPIFLPQIDKIVIVDDNRLHSELIKLCANDIAKKHTIIIPKDVFYQIDANKLIAKKLLDEGVKITIDINSIPLDLKYRNDTPNIKQYVKKEEMKSQDRKSFKDQPLPDEKDEFLDGKELEEELDEFEENEKEKSSFKETFLKYGTKEEIDHNSLQNQFKFSFYANTKKNYATKAHLKLKEDSELSDELEDQSDYSFESSEVELDTLLQYKNKCETSTGVSTIEETTAIPNKLLHDPLMSAFCNVEEPLFPELLTENANLDNSKYANFTKNKGNSDSKIKFNIEFN